MSIAKVSHGSIFRCFVCEEVHMQYIENADDHVQVCANCVNRIDFVNRLGVLVEHAKNHRKVYKLPLPKCLECGEPVDYYNDSMVMSWDSKDIKVCHAYCNKTRLMQDNEAMYIGPHWHRVTDHRSVIIRDG